ncbi:MAG: protease modulator HflC [Planctomycetaceae bacterium]
MSADARSFRTSHLAFIAFMLFALAMSSMFTVSPREMAVVVEFGKPVRGIQEPGLYFKIPLIQEVRRVPRTRQFWANARDDMLVDLPTRDGKKIEVSVWAIWRITDPEKFVRVLQTLDNAEQQVRQRVRAGVRDVITSYDLSEVVRSSNRELTYSLGMDPVSATSATDSASVPMTSHDVIHAGEVTDIRFGREKILDEIRNRIRSQIVGDGAEGNGDSLDRGIELVDVGISSIGFVQSVRIAAFERLKAFMDSIASGHKNAGVQRKAEILNQTSAEVEKILGEGEEQSKRIRGEVEAEIIELYAQALRTTGDFYQFQRTLEVYEKSLGADTRMILTTDNDLLRLLKEPGKADKLPPTNSGDNHERSNVAQ